MPAGHFASAKLNYLTRNWAGLPRYCTPSWLLLLSCCCCCCCCPGRMYHTQLLRVILMSRVCICFKLLLHLASCLVLAKLKSYSNKQKLMAEKEDRGEGSRAQGGRGTAAVAYVSHNTSRDFRCACLQHLRARTNTRAQTTIHRHSNTNTYK